MPLPIETSEDLIYLCRTSDASLPSEIESLAKQYGISSAEIVSSVIDVDEEGLGSRAGLLHYPAANGDLKMIKYLLEVLGESKTSRTVEAQKSQEQSTTVDGQIEVSTNETEGFLNGSEVSLDGTMINDSTMTGIPGDDATINGASRDDAATTNGTARRDVSTNNTTVNDSTTTSNKFINHQNVSGNTALHWAALNGHLEIVKALVGAGADVLIVNGAGRDAVVEAEYSSQKGAEECANWLLKECEVLEGGVGLKDDKEMVMRMGEVEKDDREEEGEKP